MFCCPNLSVYKYVNAIHSFVQHFVASLSSFREFKHDERTAFGCGCHII